MDTELGDGLVLVLGVERGVAGGEVHDGAVSRHHAHPDNVLRPNNIRQDVTNVTFSFFFCF